MGDLMTPVAEAPASAAFDNSYARLPDRFFVRTAPTSVAAPRLIKVNDALARQLGFDPAWLASAEGVEALCGNRTLPGSEPIAMAYAGHQFGHFVPQLGDGRAVLLGEVIDHDGVRYDVQLKGAGRTAFSRGGDGRAALGPVLREYVVSEAMAALGIPTTRALAAVTTGEEVWRDEPLPGAILTRVARGHIRIGTFQFFAARGDADGVRVLADYVIDRFYPEIADAPNPYRALLDTVIQRVAALVARWQMVGFIHGVMNTDNMSVAGETIDYGPCAFMDFYHPETVYSSIDVNRRYAFGEQARIAYWNLARLAEPLLPLLDPNEEASIAAAHEALGAFPEAFGRFHLAGLRAKLGLAEAHEADAALAQELLNAMAADRADFTLTFRRLSEAAAEGPEGDAAVRALFADPAPFDAWAGKWRARLAQEGGLSPERRARMQAVNPAFIPRNHRVQAVITAAETVGDYGPFEELLRVLSRPYEDQPGFEHYADGPKPDEVVERTFCGT